MSRPIVGITLAPAPVDGIPRLLQNQAYFDAVRGAGGLPVGLVPEEPGDLRRAYQFCAAVLLPGGPDVEPRRYGEVPREGCRVDSLPVLDEAELALARWAVADGKPLLGICRGVQVLNVALGGTLWQDLRVQLPEHAVDHDRRELPRDTVSHRLDVLAGTRLARITAAPTLEANSLHHQGLRELAPALQACAISEGGLVEAVEGPEHPFLVAVQPHPEELISSQRWARRLFDELVAAAR